MQRSRALLIDRETVLLLLILTALPFLPVIALEMPVTDTVERVVGMPM